MGRIRMLAKLNKSRRRDLVIKPLIRSLIEARGIAVCEDMGLKMNLGEYSRILNSPHLFEIKVVI